MRYVLILFLCCSCAHKRLPASDPSISPDLDFILDEQYLALHTLKAKTNWNSKGEIVAFQKKVWEQHQRLYKALIDIPKIYPDEINDYLKDLASKSVKLPEFEPIKKRTRQYLGYVKKQWIQNLPQTTRIMNKLTGLDLNRSHEVYITHPALRNGTQLGVGQIGWGHSEDWPNYTTVYLWHEILHPYLSKSDLDHSIIELATDNELRVRMNGGSYPPIIGHKYLKKTTSKILPYWKKYLKKNDKNLINFAFDMKVK